MEKQVEKQVETQVEKQVETQEAKQEEITPAGAEVQEAETKAVKPETPQAEKPETPQEEKPETPRQENAEPPQATKDPASPAVASAPASGTVADGPLWVLQVGSFRSLEDAKNFARLYATRHAFLRGLRDGVEEAKVNGTQYFRAYYGPWISSDTPLQICRRLKSAESDCLVKRLR